MIPSVILVNGETVFLAFIQGQSYVNSLDTTYFTSHSTLGCLLHTTILYSKERRRNSCKAYSKKAEGRPPLVIYFEGQ